MRAVVQRVLRAAVSVDGAEISAIDRGILVFIGVQAGDTDTDIDYIVRKCIGMRIFGDAHGRMSVSVQDLRLEVLVVSQFTLLGDMRHGRRPDFTRSGRVEAARKVYRKVEDAFRATGLHVRFGEFQAHMDVSLVNDGPVTILLDSRKEF